MKLSQVLLYSLKKSKRIIKQSMPTALSTAAIICLGLTVKEAIKEAPEAERHKESLPEDISTVDYICTMAPKYKGTITMSAITAGLIAGSNVLSVKQQASLLASYKFLEKSYYDYRDKVIDLFGIDADRDVVIAQAEERLETEHPIAEEDEELFWDSYSKRYFTDTWEHITFCIKEINRKLQKRGVLEENEWYWLLDNDEVPPLDTDDMKGWSIFWFDMHDKIPIIDISPQRMTTDDGLEYYILAMNTPPVSEYIPF